MSASVYRQTGVRRPAASPAALQALASLLDEVHSSAVAQGEATRAVIDGVLESNEGKAADAFEASMTGENTSPSKWTRAVPGWSTATVSPASGWRNCSDDPPPEHVPANHVA